MYMLKSNILYLYYRVVQTDKKIDLIPKMNKKLDTVYELLTNIMLINSSSVAHTTLSSDLPIIPIEYLMLGMFLILVIDTLLLIILIISKRPLRDTGRSIQA